LDRQDTHLKMRLSSLAVNFPRATRHRSCWPACHAGQTTMLPLKLADHRIHADQAPVQPKSPIQEEKDKEQEREETDKQERNQRLSTPQEAALLDFFSGGHLLLFLGRRNHRRHYLHCPLLRGNRSKSSRNQRKSRRGVHSSYANLRGRTQHVSLRGSYGRPSCLKSTSNGHHGRVSPYPRYMWHQHARRGREKNGLRGRSFSNASPASNFRVNVSRYDVTLQHEYGRIIPIVHNLLLVLRLTRVSSREAAFYVQSVLLGRANLGEKWSNADKQTRAKTFVGHTRGVLRHRGDARKRYRLLLELIFAGPTRYEPQMRYNRASTDSRQFSATRAYRFRSRPVR